MKIRNKIIYLFIAITGSTLLLLSIFIYLFTSHFVDKNFYTRLKARASLAASKYFKNEEGVPIYEEVRNKHLLRLVGEQEYHIKVDATKKQVSDTSAPPLPADFYDEVIQNGYAEYKKAPYMYVGVYYKQADPEAMVVLMANDEEGLDLLATLRNLLIIGFICSCVATGIASILFSNHIINPVSRIIREVNQISASNLHKRLEQEQGKDEVAQLAVTFNHMLDRLESSFEMQSNFVSNASHELKTPVTTILGEAEVTLRRPRNQEQYISSLTIIHQEAEKLDQLITSLLKMSQLGFDGKKLNTEKVRLDELLMAIKADITRRIPDNKVVLEWSSVPDNLEPAYIFVNRMWFKLAIINILHNAIKYSDNDKVTVKLSLSDDLVEITITDRGIGIPADEIVHVFEPFFRGSNTSNYVGHGLGLPLSMKIIRLHNGKINIISEKDSGTTVNIQFYKKDKFLGLAS